MKQPQKDVLTPNVPKSLLAGHSPAIWEIWIQGPVTNQVECLTS